MNRTFQVFGTLGWLYLVSRGIKRSKILCVPDHLLVIDVSKREYFKRIEITTRITHSYSRSNTLTSRRTGEIAIQQFVERIGLKNPMTLEQKLKLSLISESSYQEALYQCQKRQKDTNFIPDDPLKYLIGTAINLAQKRGEKLNWPAYYSAIRRAA